MTTYHVYGIFDGDVCLYVGMTRQPRRRERDQRRRFPTGSFRTLVLTTRAYAKELETAIIVRWKPRCNEKGGGSPGRREGFTTSPETNAKISLRLHGRVATPEHCAAISEAKQKNPWKVPDETKARMSHSHLGKKVSFETRKRMSEGQKKRYAERPVTKETRRRISEAGKGRVHSKETRRKRSESLKRYHSERREQT